MYIYIILGWQRVSALNVSLKIMYTAGLYILGLTVAN